MTEEYYGTTFDSNVKGTVFTVQKALPLLVDGAWKAAIRAFSRTWANELSGRGARVNTISPSPVTTPGLNGLAADEAGAAQLREPLADSVPLGRMGRPEEAADLALFLATGQSSFITGTEIFIDGGAKQV